MLPFVSSIVETIQLPLQSAASSLQMLCRELSQAKAEGEQPAFFLDLFYLACMILLSALRSDRSLAIHQHLSAASLLAAASLIAQVEPSRPAPQALRQVIGNEAAVNELAVLLLRSQFSTTLLTEATKEQHPSAPMRLAVTAKRILLC